MIASIVPLGADERRQAMAESVHDNADLITDLAVFLHQHPEISYAEYQAAAKLSANLDGAGFVVEQGAGSLDTAFVATSGSGSLVVGICVEYDARPDIGHACGHNLIAGAGVGAALALAPWTGELDITVKVIGCPAEEHGAGKAALLKHGVFDACPSR